MKPTQTTTPGQLFNHTGILTHAGDYAGERQQEAYDALGLTHELTGDEWCDIMHTPDEEGEHYHIYAVYADAPLTSFSGVCKYSELENSDF